MACLVEIGLCPHCTIWLFICLSNCFCSMTKKLIFHWFLQYGNSGAILYGEVWIIHRYFSYMFHVCISPWKHKLSELTRQGNSNKYWQYDICFLLANWELLSINYPSYLYLSGTMLWSILIHLKLVISVNDLSLIHWTWLKGTQYANKFSKASVLGQRLSSVIVLLFGRV